MEDFSKYNGEGTLLRRAQLRMVDILVEFDRICRANHIDYWLDSGTLIGAVRHGGFIPWDDDMDVCVLRKDYCRLRKAMVEQLSSDFVFVDSSTDKNFYDNCGRVKDKNSVVDWKEFRAQKEQGLYLDILVCEPSYPVFKRLIDPVYGPLFRQVHNFGRGIYDSECLRIAKKAFSCVFFPFAAFVVAFARFFVGITKPDCVMLSYSTMFQSRRYLSQIFPLSEVRFEGHSFFAPGDTDSYLRNIYGDYMKIPPADKRPQHFTKIIFKDDSAN